MLKKPAVLDHVTRESHSFSISFLLGAFRTLKSEIRSAESWVPALDHVGYGQTSACTTRFSGLQNRTMVGFNLCLTSKKVHLMGLIAIAAIAR